MKLSDNQLHLLRLCAKGMKENDGWAKVSAMVWPLIEKLPGDLIEIMPGLDGSGLARLTDRGDAVITYS
jgi:hypothetical protein